MRWDLSLIFADAAEARSLLADAVARAQALEERVAGIDHLDPPGLADLLDEASALSSLQEVFTRTSATQLCACSPIRPTPRHAISSRSARRVSVPFGTASAPSVSRWERAPSSPSSRGSRPAELLAGCGLDVDDPGVWQQSLAEPARLCDLAW